MVREVWAAQEDQILGIDLLRKVCEESTWCVMNTQIHTPAKPQIEMNASDSREILELVIIPWSSEEAGLFVQRISGCQSYNTQLSGTWDILVYPKSTILNQPPDAFYDFKVLPSLLRFLHLPACCFGGMLKMGLLRSLPLLGAGAVRSGFEGHDIS